MDALIQKMAASMQLREHLLGGRDEPAASEREEATVRHESPARLETPAKRENVARDESAERSIIVTLSEQQRERERLLAPGAPNPTGAPYKMLRTQVLNRLSRISANTLAVLSAGQGEGKTLTAINLAIALAADTRHTALLIDFDLRNPSIARRLGFTPKVGVEECLLNRRPLHQAMVRVAGYERLTVLPAASHVEQSSELLASDRTGDLIQELRTRYVNRVLIIDLPPVLLADDALAFSRHVEAGLLVVAECASDREGVRRTVGLLDKLPVVGTVLNRSSEKVGTYY